MLTTRYKELDDIDIRIINELKNNARIGVRELARKIGKAPSTILARLKRLEELGIIKGYVTLIDYRSLGYQVTALTLLQVDGAHIEEIEAKLAAEPNVRAVYDITGEYDVAIISVFKDVNELDKFIKRILKLPYIKRSVTSIVFRIVKDSPHINRVITI